MGLRLRFSPRQIFSLVLFISLFFLTLRPIADPDFWWHLRTGQWMVENSRIPHTDPFSFTKAGSPWVAHEWLSELLIYTLFKLGGTGSLVFFFSLLITTAFYFAYRSTAREARPYLAGFSILLGALASAPTWGVRPQMFSLMFIGLFLYLLEKFRQNGRLRHLYPLPVLTLLWVNLHAGFLLGLGVIGLYISGEAVGILVALARRTKPSLAPAIHLLAALGACTLATLANPNGIRILTYPFETLSSPSMQQFIQEWFSPDFHKLEWQPLALLLLAMIGTGMLGGKPVPVTRLLVVLFCAYGALRSMRNVPFFVLSATPVLADQVSSFVRLPGEGSFSFNRSLRWLPPILVGLLLLVTGLRFFQVVNDQSKTEAENFPQAAVDWIIANHPPKNIFNTYGWGGYMIWRLYPEYRVYVDGRADLYGDAFLFDFISTSRAEPGWEARLDASSVKTVIIQAGEPLGLALGASDHWQQVYSDELSVIFVRR
jgi:hypothetical protein